MKNSPISEYVERDVIELNSRENVKKVLNSIIQKKGINFSDDFIVYHDGSYFGLVSFLTLINYVSSLQDQELQNAREIQQFLLAKNKINDPDIKIEANIKMAHELGGAFYFSIKLNENKYLVSCFDVSGKNISASLETIMLSSFFAYLNYNSDTINLENEEMLEIINYLCFDQTPASMFISAIFLFIDKKKRELEVFNCGFTNPYLYFMAKDNKAKMRTLQVNFPTMGIDAEINFKKGKTVLPITKHMKLFIYSDGLIEARNQYGHMYGYKKYCFTEQRI